MKIRFYNARIMTMQSGTELTEGEIWVEENRITLVGDPKEKAAQAPAWNREIDARGNLIMPGFKDAHTHSAMTFLRSFADDLPLQDWLNEQVFPMEAKLLSEDVVWLCKLAIMEYLTSGITSNFDMYFLQDSVARASVECGFRTVMTSGLNDFVSSLEELEESYQKFNSMSDLIGYRLGFHAEYTTSETLLKGVAELAKKYQAPVFTHSSETAKEVQGCVERHGKTPTAYFDSLGMFDYGGGSYHCVCMSEEDLDIFKKRGLTAVTCPGSNVKLASGIASIEEMLNRGIHLAVGTDGPASNNCLDMFREMFLVTGLAKLKGQDAAAVPAEAVLSMAVCGGASAMGFTDCDCLAEGKLADLIMIDLHQPNMQPLNNIAKNIVYSGSKQNVKLTMVNGKILYEDGRFDIGVEPETVYDKANEIIQRYTAQ